MKLRGAFIGLAVTLGAFSSMAACSDDSSTGADLTLDAGFNTDGSASDAVVLPPKDSSPPTDTSPPPGDSATDAMTSPAQCNDGKVDLGETCDPLASCPADCPPIQCQLRSLDNGGTCAAVCTNVALQTTCLNGDDCCPPGCNTKNDSDCKAAVCGNNVLETGETCDPLASCPSTCAPVGCQIRKVANINTCTAACVDDPGVLITKCGAPGSNNGPSDSCCPAGCNVNNDPDCAAGACGNGTKDPGETCDPTDPNKANQCPTSCPPPPADKCQLQKLDASNGTCQAVCVNDTKITSCTNGDGCCAPGCDHTNDDDCVPVCGNKVTEPPGESCDGNCPITCQNNACQILTVTGTPCNLKCTYSGKDITICSDGDNCCPGGCDSSNDKDCPPPVPTCPNGKLDPGETCDNADNSCPSMCLTAIGPVPTPACIGPTGSKATCNLACNRPIQTCDARGKDACCPFVNEKGDPCTTKGDSDCQADKWDVVTSPDPVTFKSAGDCIVFAVQGILAGGSYDFTTCAPSVQSKGDVQIKSVVVGNVGAFKGNLAANDNCDAKTSIPSLAGWTCLNSIGKNAMACASDSPGGIIANTSGTLNVQVCAVSAGAVFTFSSFYNSTKVPTIKPGSIIPAP